MRGPDAATCHSNARETAAVARPNAKPVATARRGHRKASSAPFSGTATTQIVHGVSTMKVCMRVYRSGLSVGVRSRSSGSRARPVVLAIRNTIARPRAVAEILTTIPVITIAWGTGSTPACPMAPAPTSSRNAPLLIRFSARILRMRWARSTTAQAPIRNTPSPPAANSRPLSIAAPRTSADEQSRQYQRDAHGRRRLDEQQQTTAERRRILEETAAPGHHAERDGKKDPQSGDGARPHGLFRQARAGAPLDR